MDVTLTAEQHEICAAARRFLARRCPTAHVRAMARDPRGLGYDPALWRQMAELGWLGLIVPEAAGGLGASFVDLCLLIEEQGRHIVPGPFLPVTLAAQAIARFGSADQRAAHLPAIAAGERIIALARTRPDGSWDPMRVGVTARRDRDGWILDGAATFVDYAHAADALLVIAGERERPEHDARDDRDPRADRDDREPALSAFLVATGTDADAAGLASARIETADRVPTHRVAFTGVRVPEHAALGRPGHGAAIARAIAAWGAAARCAEMVGIGQRVLEMTVAYAGERDAFGAPIGAFQAVQHRCADMALDVTSSRSVTREAIWRVANDDPRAAETVAIAKAWVSDAIARVCAHGHQVHGAIGFTGEHDLHLYTRRARAAELDFGDAAWHRARLAASLGI